MSANKLSTTDPCWIAHTPEALNPLFIEAISAGNVNAVAALFEAEGQLAPRPGQPVVQGQSAIRATVQGWLNLQLQFLASSRVATQTGDLALLRGPWQVQLLGPNGQLQTQFGRGLEIARRQPDGSWRYVLAVDGDE